MKTILTPVDFSPVTQAVTEEAVKLARRLGGRIVLLHAVQPPAIVTDLTPFAGEVLQFTDEVEKASRQQLHRLQTRLGKAGVPVTTVCGQGYALPFIVSEAKKLAADYIVIGSHGHGAFYDLIVGSVTSGVLKRATCPVVVVPAQPKAARHERNGHAAKPKKLLRPSRNRRPRTRVLPHSLQ